MRALSVFAFLTDIETFDRSVIAHYPGVDEAFCSQCAVLLQHIRSVGVGLHNSCFFDV